MEEVPVVTCFLRNRAAVLLLRRSEKVGSYAGRWGGVAGHTEGSPDAAAREEIREETGLEAQVEMVRAGEPFSVTDPEIGTRWVVHPYLFDCEARTATTNYETTAVEWVPATEILRRETVPELWESYRRVRPTVDTVRTDRAHGSSYLSLRALEVLRDAAGEFAAGVEPGGWSDLAALAEELLGARPSMVVVRNRVNRAMGDAGGGTPAAVERAAVAGIDRAVTADEGAAAEAARRLSGTVLTLSRSATVVAALEAADLEGVLVAESRPGGEGIDVAEGLSAALPTTLVPDAGVAQALAERDVDAVLVGADAVLPDGAVVNKVGTRAAALAADREGVPVFAVAARDKISADGDPDLEPIDAAEVYDGTADIAVMATTFDVTPPDLASVVTEDGVIEPEAVREAAAEHRHLADWEA